MRVLVIGAGNAGRHLASKLSLEQHDIVVVDRSEDALSELQNQLDIQTVQGEGGSPRILVQAGLEKADLLVAVTRSDEVNILACAYAHAAGVRYKVARVSNPDFINPNTIYDLAHLGIDLIVSEKEECAREIFTILRTPGTLEAVDMLEGRVLTVGIKVHMDSPIIRGTLGHFPQPELLQKIRFIAVMRGEELLIPRGDTQFMIGDDLYLTGEPQDINEFMVWASPEHARFGKIVVVGGGDMGLEVCRLLDAVDFPVVLLEKDGKRAEACARELDHALVIRGDALDQETLGNAGIVRGETAVVALTGSDENNIMICLLAEKAGASFTLAQVSKPEYVPIANTLSLLDRAVSSHISMINAILHFVRGKNVKAAALLHKLPGELLEVVLPEGSPWTGKPIRDLRIPEGVVIATVLRQHKVYAPTGEFSLLPGDRMVIFAMPKAVSRIESLFGR